ncbi:MAG: methylmalonyl-CoA mutase [Anaerolineaceae bacterium 4572_78]|nr:MAG: methylmalonyl-CoA mutase [Anaerolineaceae bacterium 4572_78]
MNYELKNELTKWQNKTLKATLKRFPERKESFQTSSDIPIERFYLPSDISVEEYQARLGFPGEYPFTRGVQPTMYRGRFWTMRQYAGYGTAQETNERFKYLLAHGQTGLSIAFDLPTQIGYDSDAPMSLGEVGKVGVAISSLEDMEILFDGIPLDKVSTSMTINAPASILLAMYIIVGKKQGVSPEKLRGTIQNDILKEYVARGTYIFPPKPSMRLITDIFAYCHEHVPMFNTISISGYHIREAGSTAVQEVAFTFANAITYINAALNMGLEIDDFGTQLSFFFNCHNNFFEEVAKFRAARRLWAKIAQDRFKATNPKVWRLRFHTQTGGSTLTVQQAPNNIARVTMQALAAVLGGTQSLHTNSMDEAMALPTEGAVQTALRTQQIIAYETGVADTIDPLAGSYFIEQLTDEIEHRSMNYIKKIDDMGGSLVAIEHGYIQQQIQESAYQYQRNIENMSQVVVGVNKFAVEDDIKPELLQVDDSIQHNQIARLASLRARRDYEAVKSALHALANAINSTDNLMPYILQAVEVYATIGEICDTLRDAWGEYQPTQL